MEQIQTFGEDTARNANANNKNQIDATPTAPERDTRKSAETTHNALTQEDKKIRRLLYAAHFEDDARYKEIWRAIRNLANEIPGEYDSGVELARRERALENILGELSQTGRGALNRKFTDNESAIDQAAAEIRRARGIEDVS